MKNVSHKKGWNSGTNPAHVEPPPIPLTKEMCDGKSDKYLVKIKLRRDPTSSTPELYQFNMYFFEHGKP